MVARTPPKLMNKKKDVVAPLNPLLLRETLKKVDKCMARLQELQYTVAGGRKVVSGISLSPRSTRGYLKTSLRCKQETVRIKNAGSIGSPAGKLPAPQKGEWKRMSLPAMLVGETIGEILQASQFAREILSSVANKSSKGLTDDPKTPLTQGRKQRIHLENSELKARRKKEKQNNKLQSLRSESNSPCLRRARSRINFKVSPPRKPENGNETARYLANRVSPRHKPWARKAVLFPNPLYTSTPSKQQQQHKFCKTRSPPSRKRETVVVPHKFLIKSPGASSSAASKFQVKIKSPPPKVSSLSPTRPARKSPPPPHKASSTVSKLRRSLSPARLANRLMSPLKGRKFVQKSSEGVISGLKQRPASTTAIGFSTRKIQVLG